MAISKGAVHKIQHGLRPIRHVVTKAAVGDSNVLLVAGDHRVREVIRVRPQPRIVAVVDAAMPAGKIQIAERAPIAVHRIA